MAQGKKYTYKCPDIPKRRFNHFEALKDEKEFCDITLRIGSEFISAHRVIITAGIPYFRAILSSKAKPEEPINLPNVDPNALRCLIEFAYTCELEIYEENVRNLFAAACDLGVDDVRDACCDFLVDILDYDNVINIRELAERFGCGELLKCTDRYITRNFGEVSKTKGFLECSSKYLKDLISKDDLNVVDEEKVLEAVVLWAKGSPNERSNELPELLSKVRMTLLEPLCLTKVVKQERIIQASLACRDLIDEARNYILFPELRTSVCSFVTVSRNSAKASKTSDNSDQYICKLHVQFKLRAQHLDLYEDKWHTKRASTFFVNGGTSCEVRKKMYFFYRGIAKEYDPVNNTYRILNAMPVHKIYVTITVLKNKIYFFGGKVGSLTSNAVECFDPEENKWTSACSMKLSCWGSSSAASGEYVFVLGGKEDTSIYDTIQRYDPILDRWKIMSSLLTKRYRAAAATLNGKIYICGGCVPANLTSETVSATAEVYDPVENKSTFISPMISSRRDLTLLSCRGILLALGGADDDGKPVKGIDKYFPPCDNWNHVETDGEADEYLRVSGAVLI